MKHSGFKSACDKLSGDSAQKAYASVKGVVEEMKKCQADLADGSGERLRGNAGEVSKRYLQKLMDLQHLSLPFV